MSHTLLVVFEPDSKVHLLKLFFQLSWLDEMTQLYLGAWKKKWEEPGALLTNGIHSLHVCVCVWGGVLGMLLQGLGKVQVIHPLPVYLKMALTSCSSRLSLLMERFQACATMPTYVLLKTESRAVCMVSKHATIWATVPAPYTSIPIFLNAFFARYCSRHWGYLVEYRSYIKLTIRRFQKIANTFKKTKPKPERPGDKKQWKLF